MNVNPQRIWCTSESRLCQTQCGKIIYKFSWTVLLPKQFSTQCSINYSAVSTYVFLNMIYTLLCPCISCKFTAILSPHFQLCWYCSVLQKQWKTSNIFHTLVVVFSGWRHWLHCVSKYWNSFNIRCSWTPEAEVTYQIQVITNQRTQRM
jgi:hypothetical protein